MQDKHLVSFWWLNILQGCYLYRWRDAYHSSNNKHIECQMAVNGILKYESKSRWEEPSSRVLSEVYIGGRGRSLTEQAKGVTFRDRHA